MTIIVGGEAWTQYTNCRKGHKASVAVCLAGIQRVCRNATHRVSKVVRLTLDNFRSVLARLPNLKLLHLFRDPRAIMNSRLTTSWYQLPSDSAVHKDAVSMCNRIRYDLNCSVDMRQRFPDRFAVIMFEDLLEDLLGNTLNLYKYLGYDTTTLPEKVTNISKAFRMPDKIENAPNGQFSNWWRKRLPYKIVQIVQNACSDVMQDLGYQLFHSHEEQQNFNNSAYKFHETQLIRSLSLTNEQLN